MRHLFEQRDVLKLAEEVRQSYHESPDLQFLSPEPIGEVEAHLKTSKHFFAVKADGFLTKLAENHALMARPLADTMSYLAETQGSALDANVIAERLSDVAKTLIVQARLDETARIELACAAFRVPVSAAKTERGSSLLGANFAKNVERLRKDKKTLIGDAPGTSQSRQRYQPYNRGQEQPRRSNWRRRNEAPNAPRQQHQQAPGPSNSTPRNVANINNNNSSTGTQFCSLSECYSQWQSITSDAWVLNTVRGYKINFSSPPTLPIKNPVPHNFLGTADHNRG